MYFGPNIQCFSSVLLKRQTEKQNSFAVLLFSWKTLMVSKKHLYSTFDILIKQEYSSEGLRHCSICQNFNQNTDNNLYYDPTQNTYYKTIIPLVMTHHMTVLRTFNVTPFMILIGSFRSLYYLKPSLTLCYT